MADLGYVAVALVLFASVYAMVASVVGQRRGNETLAESAQNGAYLAALASSVALASLLYLLIAGDYGVKYVYEHASSGLPLSYTISALWAGQEGSLLVWVWMVALLGVTIVVRGRRWPKADAAYVLGAIAFVQASLSSVLLLASNPFSRLPRVPADGMGLNPLLQNIWMTIHPPVVFAGYAAYTVPFALAIGGLATGRLGRDWLREVRSWALLAWLLLGAGILMGAWWAYLELGWGGYWGWDPVENSSLIPWLTGTALLHSIMMQRRNGSFKVWNLWMIVLSFVLCIFATFVTRSGIIKSVHAFERSSLGYYFILFMAMCLAGFGGLLVRRQDDLKRESVGVGGLLSRGAGLFFTNLLFAGAALVVFVGTMFPALVELLQGRQVALDAAFYERTVGPIVQIIVLFMGVCPWLVWGRSSASRIGRQLLPGAGAALVAMGVLALQGRREVWALLSYGVGAFVLVSIVGLSVRDVAARRQRVGDGWPAAVARTLVNGRGRYGAHLVHAGIVLIAIGITGSSVYQSEVQTALVPGESVEVQGYRIEFRELQTDRNPEHQRTVAHVEAYRGSRKVATLLPKKDYYWNKEQWVTEVAIHSTLKEDLYVILAGFEQDGMASFRFLINPLVIWLWIGGAALLLGGGVAWWPSRARADA